MPAPARAQTISPTDGRLARGERSRRAVIDALLDLLSEGDPRPTAARIAERAGLSLRSVFQHFDNLETLLGEAVERHFERLQPLLRPISPAGPRPKRIASFVVSRTRLLEAIAPVRRAALLEEPRSAAIATGLARSRALGRVEIERVFAHELDRLSRAERRDVVAGVAMLASFSAWDELRRHQNLSPARARRVVHAMLERVLPAG